MIESLTADQQRALLAQLLEQKAAARRRTFPASYPQEGLWFLHRLEPESPAYNIPMALRLSGRLRWDVLERCLHEIVRRHWTLRTSLGEDPAGGGIVQTVHPFAPFPLPVLDLAGLADPDAELRRHLAREVERPFDLARAPLFRAGLLRLEPEEHVVYLVVHHTVFDGWSMGVLVRELVALYRAFAQGEASPLPELPIQYVDFAGWQRERLEKGALDPQLAYWRERFQDRPPVLELPADRPRPARWSFRGAACTVELPASLAAALADLGRNAGGSSFMVLLAGLYAILYRLTGQGDLCVGSPVANRNRSEVEGLLGFFANTLVLRARASGGEGFAGLLGEVKRTALEAYAHQDLPFEKLVEELRPERDLSRTPLFQVMLTLQNAPLPPVALPDVTLAVLEPERTTARFDLLVEVMEAGGGLRALFEHSADLFDLPTAVRMSRLFRTLLEEASAAPGRPLAELPLLGEAERFHLLAEWNDTARTYPEADLRLHQLFETQARRTPEAEAVRFEGRSLSYAELDRDSGRLAVWLRAQRVEPESLVGVLLDRSFEMVTALLGVLRAGGAYLPLDPSYPAERLAFFVADAAPRLVLTVRSLVGLLPEGVRAVCLDEGVEAAGPSPRLEVPNEAAAYAIYTSGSTGRPKAAVNAHSGIVNRILWMQEAYGLTPADRVLQKTPFSFDVSVWEFFWPLATGACLVMARPGGHRDPAYLAEVIAAEGVTTLHFVPSLLRAFLEAEELERCVSIRRVLASGEELPAGVVARFFERLGWAELHNLYGPTEAAVDVTAWACRPEDARIPIGHPIANVAVHVVDGAGELVSAGVPGELLLGGAGVGRGYLGRPELTAERFVPDPFGAAPGGRLYRTGDLARRRPAGAVDFLGRTDFQVKIRGFRIELPEIEAALQRLPGVDRAVVVARAYSGDDRRLVAYVVPASLDPEALRTALRRTLPEYMVPAAFVALSALPLSPNGKLDRKALPEPGEARTGGGYVAPRTAAEELIAGIWAEVLGIERLSVVDNPFDLGAHSLLATQVLTRLNRDLELNLPLRALFELPTPALLAAQVEKLRGGGIRIAAPPIRPVPRDGSGTLPLSFAQQRVWFFDRWEPGSAVFNLPTAIRLQGELSVSALEAGLAEVVRRHEGLRTRFLDSGGDPMQEATPAAPVPLPVVDISPLPEAIREAERERLEAEEAVRPFDLAAGPLVRAALVRLSQREHLALLTMHHIVSDGWSLGLFTREMSAAYEAFAASRRPALPELPIQFADYAAWQRAWLQGEVLAAELAFWRGRLAGAPDSLELPFDRPRGAVQRYRGGRRPVALPRELAARLRAVGRESGATLFMVLLAAWKTLLARYSGQLDVSTGTVIANRHRREVEGLIGFFINTLVVRAQLEEETTFRQALRRLREVTLDVYAHQDMPFEKLVEEINPERHLSLTPLFQTMLILQNLPSAPLELPGLRLEVREIERHTVNYDLLFTLEERDGGLAGVLDYDVDLFDRATVDRLLGHFETVLRALADGPDRRLLDVPLLGEAERQHLLVEWNDTGRVSQASGKTFWEMFAEQAARRPDAPAGICRDKKVSYRGLAERANRLARTLAALGVRRDAIVPVLADRGIPFLTAIVALQRCGAAYLPLDPAHPERRLAQILEGARAGLVLSTRDHAALLRAALDLLPDRPRLEIVEDLLEAAQDKGLALSPSSLGGGGLDQGGGGQEGGGWIEGNGGRLSSLTSEPAPLLTSPLTQPPPPRGEGQSPGGLAVTEPERAFPENLAYVLFTSGSTGQPKGVMVEARGFLNNVRHKVEDLPLDETDAVAQTASQCFDISVWQLLAALAAGAAVHIVPDETAHDAWSLLQEVERSGITVLEIVPSLLQAVLDEVDRLGPARPALSRLRWVMPTGEAVPADLCRRWLAAYPHIPLLNLYGPSECADDVTTLVIRTPEDAGTAVAPIGRPLRNDRAYVLDARLQPVPAGVSGELCLGGAGLGRGYLHDPARTAAAFVPDPVSGEAGSRLYRTGDRARFLADGRLEFLGRMDHQVKVRGFRIETGEIEAVLRLHPAVGQAVVVARRDGLTAGTARLVAYVTSPEERGDRDGGAALRAFLAERLPDYMVPSFFVRLDALPLTPNGKIDRRSLPAPEVARGAARTAPRTRTEKVLAGIWREVLEVEEIGVEDGFFDLGGHSLLATRVLYRLRAELGVDLPLRDLFEAPNLWSLAAAVDAVLGADAGVAAVPLVLVPAEEAGLLSFAQERLWFLDQLDPGSPSYNLPNAVLLTGEVHPAAFRAVLDEIVRRHATLRMTFHAEAGRPRQRVRDELRTVLPIVDVSALPAAAAHAETVRWGTFDARRPFDLENGPLLRATLIRRGPAEHVLLLSMHHIVSDGWSMGVFLAEVAALYPAFVAGRPSPLPELEVQYPDYAYWQRQLLAGEVYPRQLAYWKEQLAGAPEALDLPGRGARPASLSTIRGGIRRFRLPGELAADLRALSRSQGTTLFMTLLAGFAALLHRYSGAPDLMIGVPVAGRSRSELESLIGFFVNTLVVRVGLEWGTDNAGLMERVRRGSLDAFTHQDLPFEKLVAEVNPGRDLDRSPLFQVMFALQNAPAGRIDLPGLSLSRFEIDTGTIRFELYLEVIESDGEMDAAVQYSLDLFDAPFIARFAEHYLRLLAGMAAAPEREVGAVPLLSASEQAQLFREWNDRAAGVPLEVPFQRLFEEHAAAHPERIAAACEGRSLTYAELNERANAVAAHLAAQGAGPESIVAVLAERGLEFLIGAVGVLKAGAAYLPLDPRHPAARMRQVLEQSRAGLVLSASALLPLVTEAAQGLPGISLFELEPLAAGRARNPPPQGGADHLAYVIFTSGSTGVPKGAMLIQRGLVNHLYAMIVDLELTADDAMAQTASQCFDISVWQFLAPLVIGGRVEIYPDAVAHDPAVLLDRAEADGVAVLEIVPSLLRLMLEEIQRRDDKGESRPALSRLRWLIPTGEAVPPELCREWYEVYPHVAQVNGYGPAECSDDVSLYRIPRQEEAGSGKSVSIGRPVLNTGIYVLDAAHRPVPLRVAGELCIAGSGVGRGYLFDPAKTAAAFLPNPVSGLPGDRLYRTGDLARFRDDGNLEFLGRFDHQVKIRGHRLELGEIEALLGEHPDLAAGVVAARPDPAGGQRLVAYVVARDGGPELTPQELREHLRSRLPDYAVPTVWMVLERLPLSPNGKVDRRALPDPGQEALAGARPYVAPRSEVETAVAEIFAGVIGLERVGVFDNFFDLGGHSLLATQAIWQLRETFGVELALRALFEAPTVAELSGVIEDKIIEQIEAMSEDEVDSMLEPEEGAV